MNACRYFSMRTLLYGQDVQGIGRAGRDVHLDFGAETRADEHSFAKGTVADDLAGEVFAPLLGFLRFCIDPIQMGLQVAIRAGNVAYLDAEENMAAVVGPSGADFDGLIGGNANRLNKLCFTRDVCPVGLRGRV